jgi:TRAP-type mannitol/chloroaromatic compound transport system permease large subunit
MLAARNGEKSSNGAVLRQVLVATMKAQQAVAIRFVGRRVGSLTCLFFVCGTALWAFTSLRDMSLQRNGFVVVTSA